MLYARVEHKELWAIIVILLTIMSYFDSAVLLDEAAVGVKTGGSRVGGPELCV